MDGVTDFIRDGRDQELLKGKYVMTQDINHRVSLYFGK